MQPNVSLSIRIEYQLFFAFTYSDHFPRFYHY